jgi:hypothetical protein
VTGAGQAGEPYLEGGRLDGHPAEVLDRGHGGQRILKVEFADGPVIVKVYGSRGAWPRVIARDVGRAIIGKSPMRTRWRHRTEGELLRLWERHGLAAPRLLDHTFPSLEGRPVHVMEFLDGPLAWNYLVDARRTREERTELIARFAAACAARHAVAIEHDERGLIQSRAGFAHVILVKDGFAAFDFEGRYRGRHPLRLLISLELMAYLRSLAKAAPGDFEPLLRTFLESYPDRAQLERINQDVLQGIYSPLRHLARLQMSLLPDRSRGKQTVRKQLKAALRELSVADRGPASR